MWTILTIFHLLFLFILSNLNSIDACSCLGPDEPQYCNTDFFALVYISGEQPNEKQMTIRYRFKPLTIIRDPLLLLQNRRYKNLHTYISSAACGVELKVGERYLVGGNLDRKHDRLALDLCRSFVEQYSHGMAVVTKEFHSLLENCRESNNDNPIVTTQKFKDEPNNKIQDRNVEKVESEAVEVQNERRNIFDSELEREGRPIIKFNFGITEDILRKRNRTHHRRQFND